MSKIALRFDGVWKKFRRGERFDSLRDLIPALARRLVRRRDPVELGKKEFWALRNVSFAVRRGQAFGIIGPNGAGKSTVLKLLSGLLRPTRGRMHVRGRLSALIEVGAGFHPDLTGRENIFLNGAILGMTQREVAEKLDRIVDFSGLPDVLDTPVKRYSSGMFARLGFSVAAHMEPDILLVDEVLSVGDVGFQAKCIRRMQEVCAGGTTVVFISHNVSAMSLLCEKAMVLVNGEAKYQGDVREAVSCYFDASGQLSAVQAGDGPATLSEVRLLGPGGKPCSDFASREEVTVEMRFRAREYLPAASGGLWLRTPDGVQVFDTSAQRLGVEPSDVAPGDTLTCRFRLRLNLAGGTYLLGGQLVRYGPPIEAYFSGEPVAMVSVRPVIGAGGIVDLHPRASQVLEPADACLEALPVGQERVP